MSKKRQSSIRFFDLTLLDSFSAVNMSTNGEVLRKVFSIKDNTETKNFKGIEISRQIYNELQGLCKKNPITMKENLFGVRKFFDLYEKWRNIKKFKNSGTGSKA